VVSGDIANSGRSSEYEIARTFFQGFMNCLRERYEGAQIRLILVPGNHDCNFDIDSQLRINTVNKIGYDTIGTDDSVIDMCLKVQADFWKFYDDFQGTPDR
jgi:hypothetical protein